MVQPEMAELVREYGLQFRDCQGLDQGVEKYDPLGAAKPREVGVAMRAAFRPVHDEHAARLKAAAAGERLDGLAESARFEFPEAVEERSDQPRPGPAEDDRERRPGAPRPDPPGRAGARHQPQQQERERKQEQGADREAFQRVHREQCGRGAIEPEPRLDAERAPGFEWQACNRRDEEHHGDCRHLGWQARRVRSP